MGEHGNSDPSSRSRARTAYRRRVRIGRFWEVYCEDHGVIGMEPTYQRAKEEMRRHTDRFPECLVPIPSHPEAADT